jgi:sulfonate transport system substrate-binding protein
MKTALRNILGTLLASVLLSVGVGLTTYGLAHAAEPLRVGYQKYGTLVILKARGTLEQRLKPLGVEVKWTEFPSGPTLLEALNVGSIDYGTVGEAPPIFAQAAGADLVYTGNEPPAPASEAIVVQKDSPIKTVADLKGKKVALNKGSNVHYLLVKVLEKHGLQYKDVEVSFLPPADARAAFERGSVDAWVIWDPFLSAAEKQIGARVLANGTGVVDNHQFYVARRGYAEKNPQVTKIVLEELDKIGQWGKKNPKEVAAFLAPYIGLDLPSVELAAGRFSYGVAPVSDKVIASQQKIADTFYDLKLIPKKLVVKEATLAGSKADPKVSVNR